MDATGGGGWGVKWSSSLEDFREFDPDSTIGTPRSLAACDAQGILPRELRYKPLEVFQLPGVDPRVAQLRYDFMESRRQDLLAAAKATRLAIMELAAEAERADEQQMVEKKKPGDHGRTPDLHTHLQPNWQDGGPPDPSLAGPPTTPYPGALSFFHEVLDEYSFSKASASPPASPKTSAEGGLDMGTVTLPSVLGGTLKSPPKTPGSTMREKPVIERAASEPEIRNLLSRVKNGPRATRADVDFAKKSEDLQIVYPKLQGRWRRAANSDQRRLTNRRVDMAADCFDRLIIQDEENYQSLQWRAAMHKCSQEDDPTRLVSQSPFQSPPASPFSTLRLSRMSKSSSKGFGTSASSSATFSATGNGTIRGGGSFGSSGGFGDTGRMSFEERQEIAREKNLEIKRDFEIKRAEALQDSINSHQTMKERLVADALGTKWRVAQELLEERVKWRLNYDKVATASEDHEAYKRDFFERREEQQRAQRERCNDSSAIRKEIRHLRDVNRMLNQAQRDRKKAWRLAKKERENMEKRMLASGLKVPGGGKFY